MTDVSPEALALAREQLPGIASQEHDNPSAATAIRERATVIELRRQLADRDAKVQTLRDGQEALKVQIATERQRAEAAERWRDRAEDGLKRNAELAEASEAKRKALRSTLGGLDACGSLGQALNAARLALAADSEGE